MACSRKAWLSDFLLVEHDLSLPKKLLNMDLLDDYTLEELQAETDQETQMKKMLDQSVIDLKATVDDLETKYEQVDTEGNEWKTRFETQQEMNRQLERQLEVLKDKIQKHNGANKRDMVVLKNMEEMSDAGWNGLVRQLEKEKFSLQGQLRDMEWRLDQESKALHKANDGRKKYITEINEATFHLDSYERLQGKRAHPKVVTRSLLGCRQEPPS
ncbi:coiled-coil domain-containing protein 169-like isoform X2 [Clavelina lepadiformis]|uniref:coiled-coil domain-containing protein 169-like isoform X2 n=1 Tax=Clavelina lepadiformis TaxID=159417 RepID=UPI004043113C